MLGHEIERKFKGGDKFVWFSNRLRLRNTALMTELDPIEKWCGWQEKVMAGFSESMAAAVAKELKLCKKQARW